MKKSIIILTIFLAEFFGITFAKEQQVRINSMFKINKELNEEYDLQFEKADIWVDTYIPWVPGNWNKKIYFGGMLFHRHWPKPALYYAQPVPAFRAIEPKPLVKPALFTSPILYLINKVKHASDLPVIIEGVASETEIKDPNMVLIGKFQPDGTLDITDRAVGYTYNIYVRVKDLQDFVNMKNQYVLEFNKNYFEKEDL